MKAKPLLILIIAIYILSIFLVPHNMDENKRSRLIIEISYVSVIALITAMATTRGRGLSFKRKVLADKLLRARVFARSYLWILGVMVVGLLLTVIFGMYFNWHYIIDFSIFMILLFVSYNIFQWTCDKVEDEVEKML